MITRDHIFKLFLIICFGAAFSMAAQAQSRTWVSGVGNDADPCSRTAPCKTFAGAISKTAVNGEINCLDPGGFGAVTITKSITIDCHEMVAGVVQISWIERCQYRVRQLRRWRHEKISAPAKYQLQWLRCRRPRHQHYRKHTGG